MTVTELFQTLAAEQQRLMDDGIFLRAEINEEGQLDLTLEKPTGGACSSSTSCLMYAKAIEDARTDIVGAEVRTLERDLAEYMDHNRRALDRMSERDRRKAAFAVHRGKRR